MKDYRVTVKVRNNRILSAIEESGGKPGAKWSEANGLCYSTVNDLVNMTRSPLLENGELTATALRLCDVVNKLPEELWSNEQLYPLEKNFSEMEMDYAQVVATLPAGDQSYLPDFSAIEEAETISILDDALSKLTQKEEDVLRKRYMDGMTLAQIASIYEVGSERIRQIEAKALRKLRNPRVLGGMRDVLYSSSSS